VRLRLLKDSLDATRQGYREILSVLKLFLLKYQLFKIIKKRLLRRSNSKTVENSKKNLKKKKSIKKKLKNNMKRRRKNSLNKIKSSLGRLLIFKNRRLLFKQFPKNKLDK